MGIYVCVYCQAHKNRCWMAQPNTPLKKFHKVVGSESLNGFLTNMGYVVRRRWWPTKWEGLLTGFSDIWANWVMFALNYYPGIPTWGAFFTAVRERLKGKV